MLKKLLHTCKLYNLHNIKMSRLFILFHTFSLWLPTISEPEISARDISARTFYHQDISARACFGPADGPVHGHFVSMDISLQGHFGTRTFRHKDFSSPWIFGRGIFWQGDILAHGHFGTVALSILHCKVPKYPCAEMFRNIPCWNVHGAKNCPCAESPCVKMSMETKCLCAGTSAGPKHGHVEISWW